MTGGRRLAALVAAVAAATAGCMPEAATRQGQDMAGLYQVFLVGGVVVAAIVWGWGTFALVRYRGRRASLPPQDHGNLLVEGTWTLLPLLTVIVLFVLTMLTLGSVNAGSPQPGGVAVTVTGFQWQWRFSYPESGVVVTGRLDQPPELVLPVGEPVHVTVESLDVVHSFYVPVFLFKRDAIPGRPSTFDVDISRAGVYRGQCAEFCGVFHDGMTFSVRAVEPAAFQQWLQTMQARPGNSAGASPESSAGASAGAPAGASPEPSAGAVAGSSAGAVAPARSAAGASGG